MAVDLTYILTLKDAGDKTFVMPSGFESNVEIHCWGAGGGPFGGSAGGISILPGTGGTASTYNTPGTHTFTVPAGVTLLSVSILGGGGGGGGGTYNGGNNVTRDGTSGGGGATKSASLSVTPGQVITFTVGTGGIGGGAYVYAGVMGSSGPFNGGNGGVTSFLSMTAQGGGGGQGGNPSPVSSGLQYPGASYGGNNGGAGGSASLGGATAGSAGGVGRVTITIPGPGTTTVVTPSVGGTPGGGGGYAKTYGNISAGDIIRLQVGVSGTTGIYGGPTGGIGGTHPSYTRYRGGNAGAGGEINEYDNDMGSGGGGGGASAVLINNIPICIGAGGGGAGGAGDDAGASPGSPGGVYPGMTTDIYPVTLDRAWSTFLRTYGIWGGGQDYTTTISFPTTGVYTFNYSVDNYGTLYLDGSAIITRTGEHNYENVYTYTATVSAGNHIVRVTGVNTGGPAGVAAQVLKPDSSELWNTRALTVNGGLTSTTDGGVSADGWASGGGGGGGYYGGLAGTSYGDDSGPAPGGNGGQNYGDLTLPGSGGLAGGKSTTYYPTSMPNTGDSGYPGYIVMIFTRKSGLQIKNPDGSGDWVSVTHPYVKVPSYSYIVYTDVPPATVSLTSSSGSFTVPAGVTSLTVNMVAGGGSGGGGNDYGSGAGGSGGYYQNYNYAVTPGQVISYSVGGSGGNTTFGTLTCTAGGNGGLQTYDTGTAGSPNGTAGGAGGQPGPAGGRGADSPFGIGGAGGVGGGPGRTGNSGSSATGYGAGGGGGGNNKGGGGGSPGLITVYYSSPTLATRVTSGGWKEITQTYVKVDGDWKSVSQQNAITVYNYK